ncbi:hypothetical protein [Mycolicibacterium neoaurum]|uniref:hypothetical protein n=1 Tax=Mycolicibacterium neoaurum TaxID=1795 RepID=UPI001F4D3094|nr:hypothetical protein [Mycolicibacterium neoaurum]
MDFALRYDRWYRPFASLMGVGPLWTTVRVVDGWLVVRHGWAFRFEVPVDKIETAAAISERPMSWGAHQATDGWLVNGSRDGIVKVTFSEPVSPQRASFATLFAKPFRALYLSLAEPEAFVAALTATGDP